MYSSILDVAKGVEDILAANEICGGEAARVRALIDKLENNKITVSVIGQFKRGKSTLVNGILGDKILPVGIVPVTSVVTSVNYGEKSAAVHFNNGKIENVDFDKLSTYISEQENTNNVLGVNSVVLKSESDFLKNGVTFVDTPGVGSYHKHNTDVAYAFMKESDAVIFMLSVDSPINQIEIDFLENAKEYAAKFYFAVNKIDTVEEDELSAYLFYCEKLLCELMDVDKVAMFPVSAKKNLGIEELKAAINDDCHTEIKGILEESTRMKLIDVIKDALVHLDLNWKALNMPLKDLTERFDELTAYITNIKEEADEIVKDRKPEDNLEIKINEFKLGISDKVLELFEMEYKYEIKKLESTLEDKTEEKKFMDDVNDLCADLEKTLNTVLMYREENAYTVCRHISKLNRLTKNLRKILNLLK